MYYPTMRLWPCHAPPPCVYDHVKHHNVFMFFTTMWCPHHVFICSLWPCHAPPCVYDHVKHHHVFMTMSCPTMCLWPCDAPLFRCNLWSCDAPMCLYIVYVHVMPHHVFILFMTISCFTMCLYCVWPCHTPRLIFSLWPFHAPTMCLWHIMPPCVYLVYDHVMPAHVFICYLCPCHAPTSCFLDYILAQLLCHPHLLSSSR